MQWLTVYLQIRYKNNISGFWNISSHAACVLCFVLGRAPVSVRVLGYPLSPCNRIRSRWEYPSGYCWYCAMGQSAGGDRRYWERPVERQLPEVLVAMGRWTKLWKGSPWWSERLQAAGRCLCLVQCWGEMSVGLGCWAGTLFRGSEQTLERFPHGCKNLQNH